MQGHPFERQVADLFPTRLGCYNSTRLGRPVPPDDGVLFWLSFFMELR